MNSRTLAMVSGGNGFVTRTDYAVDLVLDDRPIAHYQLLLKAASVGGLYRGFALKSKEPIVALKFKQPRLPIGAFDCHDAVLFAHVGRHVPIYEVHPRPPP
jgi:hypothetical protein